MIFCAMFPLNLSSDSGEEYFPEWSFFLENVVALHLNKFEISLPKNILWQIWLKLIQWFWNFFLKMSMYFGHFHCFVPSDRGVSFHVNKLEFTSPKKALCCVKFGWNQPCVHGSGEEDDNVES